MKLIDMLTLMSIIASILGGVVTLVKEASSVKGKLTGIILILVLPGMLFLHSPNNFLTMDIEQMSSLTAQNNTVTNTDKLIETSSTSLQQKLINYNTKITTDEKGFKDLLIDYKSSNMNFVIVDIKKNEKYKLGATNEKEKAAGLIYLAILVSCYQLENENPGFMDNYVGLSYISGGTGKFTNNDLGKQYSINDLIAKMITNSDNTAANHIIDAIGGFGAVNNSTRSIGCKSTELNRYLADSNAIKKGVDNYTSLDDMVIILNWIANLDLAKRNEILGYMNKTDNRGLSVVENNDIKVFHQTGSLGDLFNDAGIISTPNNNYIIVTMCNGNNLEENEKKVGDFAKKIIQSIGE